MNTLSAEPKGDSVTKNLLAIPGIRIEKNYPDLLKSREVSITDQIEAPPVCLEIGRDGSYTTLCTQGNVSTVIGKAKQGKTFALSLLLAAALISGHPFQQIIRAAMPANKSVCILFDTEQSKYHVHKVLRRICYLADIAEPENIIVYSLRGDTTAERRDLIEYAIYNTANIGLVVIDGIRDLVTDINNPDQSTEIASKLLKWTEDLNIHIMTVLHMNKGDQNARGHLGTELVNKSETVFSVAKSPENNEVSIVQPEYCRNKDFEPFAFSIDEHGIPNILNDWQPGESSEKSNKKIVAPHDVDPSTHLALLTDIFSVQGEMRHAELVIAAQANIHRWLSNDIGKNKVNGWITHWKQFELITMIGTERTRSAKYKINSNAPKKLN